MKRIILTAMVAIGCVSLVQAQQKTGEEQFVVYKWYQNGRAHYAKVPPRGVTNYIKLNEWGIVITDRSDEDESNGSTLSPIRPNTVKGAQITPAGTHDKQAANAPPAAAQPAAQSNEALPEGTIPRETLCQESQNDLNTINNSKEKTLYIQDENGNRIPLSAEQVENRRAQAQEFISSYCN